MAEKVRGLFLAGRSHYSDSFIAVNTGHGSDLGNHDKVRPKRTSTAGSENADWCAVKHMTMMDVIHRLM